jgi:F-type H+-transporting ATPase subunit alpha
MGLSPNWDYTLDTIFKTKGNNFFKDIGIVDAIADGIVSINGLNNVAFGETVIFCLGNKQPVGLILNLDISKVSAVILDNNMEIKPGQIVLRKCELMSVPTGQALLGRVVNLFRYSFR